MASFMQYEVPGGHQLRGEANLADGRATFLLTFTNVLDESTPEPQVVDSVLTGIAVYLNNCLVRDPEFAHRLYHEARMQQLPS